MESNIAIRSKCQHSRGGIGDIGAQFDHWIMESNVAIRSKFQDSRRRIYDIVPDSIIKLWMQVKAIFIIYLSWTYKPVLKEPLESYWYEPGHS